MIQTLVFVLIFVGLGLAVVAVAMRSGRKTSPHGAGASRGQQHATMLAVTLTTLVFGVGLPLVVVIANAENKAEDGPGGVELNGAQAKGRQLFAANCSTCHALEASNAVGRVGPDLDQLRPPAALTLDAIENGRARGQGQMPDGLLDGEDAENVASYIQAVAGRDS